MTTSLSVNPKMPPAVVCTGFDITHALRRYLEVGHNIDVVQLLNEALAGTEEDPKDYVSATDAVMHALDRETALVESLQEHFERIIENAPAEDKEVLEIPYCESQTRLLRNSGFVSPACQLMTSDFQTTGTHS